MLEAARPTTALASAGQRLFGRLISNTTFDELKTTEALRRQRSFYASGRKAGKFTPTENTATQQQFLQMTKVRLRCVRASCGALTHGHCL